MTKSATGLFDLGAHASGAGVLLWSARLVLGQGGDHDKLDQMSGHGGHAGQGGVLPGDTRQPGRLDTLTYPPLPEPARAGRVREFELVAEATVLEVAKGIIFHAHQSEGAELG